MKQEIQRAKNTISVVLIQKQKTDETSFHEQIKSMAQSNSIQFEKNTTNGNEVIKKYKVFSLIFFVVTVVFSSFISCSYLLFPK